MTSCVKLVFRWFGRFLLFGVLVAQMAVFSHYASLYFPNKDLYALVLLVVPVLGIWIFLSMEHTKQLNWQWLVWLVYTIFVLAPMVILLFRRSTIRS